METRICNHVIFCFCLFFKRYLINVKEYFFFRADNSICCTLCLKRQLLRVFSYSLLFTLADLILFSTYDALYFPCSSYISRWLAFLSLWLASLNSLSMIVCPVNSFFLFDNYSTMGISLSVFAYIL